MSTVSRLVELHEVAARIGDGMVLRGVNLRIEPGEAVGLVGETGSGKTMTGRVITGLLGQIGGRVVAGAVTVAGRDMTDAGESHWRTLQGSVVALVPQSSMSSLDPVMPIGQQLVETIRLGGHRRREAQEARRLLRSVQLDGTDGLMKSYPHQLSGGMRQRVMIALGLARGPRLLVADEPTTALDAAVRRDIYELLSDLRRDRGLAILLISHDLGAISAATESVVVMYAGRSVETGPTSSVVTDPRHPYTKALLDAAPQRSAPGSMLVALPGRAPSPKDETAPCAFAPRCSYADATCHEVPPARESRGHRSYLCRYPVGSISPTSGSVSRGAQEDRS